MAIFNNMVLNDYKRTQIHNIHQRNEIVFPREDVERDYFFFDYNKNNNNTVAKKQ